MTTVAELLIESLAEHGVRQVWGVVGDALNPVTDAIRREDRIEWIGVRHEEAAAFAASAQAQLTDDLAVCMGTVGPGAIHLLNGLYDAKKSHAPVLAICGQVPREEMGSDFFQEVDNDVLFADVAVFCETVTRRRPAAAAHRAGRQRGARRARRRGADPARATSAASTCRSETPVPTLRPRRSRSSRPDPDAVRAAADAINAAGSRDAAGRPGRAARPRRGAAARRAPRGADGAVAQGQGRLRRRQPLRDRPVRADRQPGDRAGLRLLRRRWCCSAPTSPTRSSCRPGRPSCSSTSAARTSDVVRRSTTRSSATPGSALGALLPLLEREDRPQAPRPRPQGLRAVGQGPGALHRPRLRPQAGRAAAPQGRQPRRPDPPRAARRRRRAARRRRRDLHHRHRDVDGVAEPLRADERAATAARAPTTSARWPTRCRWRSAPRRSTATARSSPSAATAGCRC